MQSLRMLLAAAAVLTVAAAQGMWEPTTRDKTAKCIKQTQWAPPAAKCEAWDECCEYDPLNGDKCQIMDKICDADENAEGGFRLQCKYRNCTEQITTTTTTTTSAPIVNVGAGSTLLLAVSALLPRFLL